MYMCYFEPGCGASVCAVGMSRPACKKPNQLAKDLPILFLRLLKWQKRCRSAGPVEHWPAGVSSGNPAAATRGYGEVSDGHRCRAQLFGGGAAPAA